MRMAGTGTITIDLPAGSSKMRKSILQLAVAVCVVFSAAGRGLADTYTRSPISVTIKLTKTSFELYEPIEGDVILSNARPVSLPAVFEVRLYRQGRLKYQGTLSVPTVFTGQTKIPLKNAGIPHINDNLEAAGRWHLAILQKNTDPRRTARVSFVIRPADLKKNPKSEKDK